MELLGVYCYVINNVMKLQLAVAAVSTMTVNSVCGFLYTSLSQSFYFLVVTGSLQGAGEESRGVHEIIWRKEGEAMINYCSGS